ncbi:MAG: hypothetical protein WC565_04745 [Parcubacteria group bacterium]
MIAALFVQPNGVYADMPGVEVWDESRDARLYPGPHAVVAHPPCERWGRYWSGGPSAKVKRKLGDDGGCFESALESVRKWGGVLEHPEASHAWRAFDLIAPPKSGGWFPAGDFMGYTCCVEQGHYGHRARKATWLYAVGCDLPYLIWGKAEGKIRLESGYHSIVERAMSRTLGGSAMGRIKKSERSATPIAFRDILLAMARSVRR